MTTINTQLGTWIAASGLVVFLLAQFGIIIDSGQAAQTITDVFKVIGEIAAIYGVIHQSVATARVAGLARNAGVAGIK